MKTWQKNKARSKWNREKKKRTKPIDIQPIDTPFTVIKEYPNVVTLGCVKELEGFLAYLPVEVIEKEIARELADNIIPYINIQSTHDISADKIIYRAYVKVLDEGRRRIDIRA